MIANVPGAITVECDNIPTGDPAAVTVTDNCSASIDITVVVNDVTTPGACANTYTITRTWTATDECNNCLLYTSPSPRDATLSRMPSSA